MSGLPALGSIAALAEVSRLVSSDELLEMAPVGRLYIVTTDDPSSVSDAPVVMIDAPEDLVRDGRLPGHLRPVLVTPYATLIRR